MPVSTSSAGATGYSALDVTTGVRIAPTAVVRMAAFGWRHLRAFDGGDLPRSVERLMAAEAALAESRGQLIAFVHDRVPTVPADQRSALLRVRRAASAGRRLPAGPAPSSQELDRLLDRYADDLTAVRVAKAHVEETHHRVLTEERLALRATAGDDEFRRALHVANPAVAEQWDHRRAAPPDERSRTRRLELTLWRYLVRAVTRPLPQAGWAGVVPVEPHDAAAPPGDSPAPVTVGAAPARTSVSPDLDVMAAIAARRAASPSYRRARLRREPSVQRGVDGWRIVGAGDDGPCWILLGTGPFLDALLGHWDDGQGRPADGAVAGLIGLGMEVDAAWGVVDDALANGILATTVDVDPAAPDPWTALDGVTDGLVSADRERWTVSVRELRAVCTALEDAYDAAPVRLVADLVDVAAEVVAELWAWAGFEEPAPRQVLHVDRRLPFVARWSADGRERTATSVRALLAFHAADGGAERYRRAATARIRDGIGRLERSFPGGVPALDLLAASGSRAVKAPATDRFDLLVTRLAPDDDGLAAEVAAHVATWEGRVLPMPPGQARSPVVLDLSPHDVATGRPGPAGTVVVPLGPDGRWWAPWGRPQPAMFVGRHHGLLGAASPAAALLERSDRWAHVGVVAAEVVGRDPANRTVSMRPPTTRRRLDPAGAPDATLAALLVALEGDTIAVRDRDGRRLLPLYGSPAVIGGHDPASLLLRTLAMAHGWEWLSMGLPVLPAEERGGGRPAVHLGPDIVLAPPRWVLPPGTADAFVTADSALDRYLAWLALAPEGGWPDVIEVRWDPNPNVTPLTVLSRSPLAIEALADRLPPGARVVVTAAAGPDAGLAVPGGDRHAAELVTIWWDDDWRPQTGNRVAS